MAGTTLGTAYVQIAPSAQGISGSISNVLGGEAQSAGTSVGTNIASFAKKAIAAAGIGAAVVKGLKASLSEGAALQQSYLGGVDTLYGEAADQVRGYARDAAKAGISMNDYSEQAVSFGAALKQAYGGDVKKSAEAANVAIMDMADNSAKMGTDITSVQTAYQGFAKQNYTMLDNLKLGYGGTKEEMQRLLSDAEKLSGQTYSIDNLGDVYDAIHVIQQDMGLTGVAAQEASQTFSGSFGAMKAAASNFAGSLALGEGVQPALQELLGSIGTFVSGNLMPMIGTIVRNIPTVIGTLISEGVPKLLTSIGNSVANLATSLKSKADTITSGKVRAWASTTIPKLLTTAGQLIGKFAAGLVKNIPTIIKSVGKIGLEIIKGLGEAIWPKIKEAATGIKDRFMEPINTLKEKIQSAIEKIKSIFNVKLELPHFKLPHFRINGGELPWGIGGKGTPPSIGVDWRANGGIVKDATLIGAGEAGAEAIMPLKPFWAKMDKLIDSMQGGGVVINVYGAPGMSVDQLAAAVEQRLVRQTNQRRAAWGTI